MSQIEPSLEGGEAFPDSEPKSSEPKESPKATRKKTGKKKPTQVVDEGSVVKSCLEKCKKKCLTKKKYDLIQNRVHELVQPAFNPDSPQGEQILDEVQTEFSIENWMGVFKKLVDRAKAKFGVSKNNAEALLADVDEFKQDLKDNKEAFIRIYGPVDPDDNDNWSSDKNGQKVVQAFIQEQNPNNEDYEFDWNDFLNYIVEDITKDLDVPEAVKPKRAPTPPPSPGERRIAQPTEAEFVIPQERAKYTLAKQQSNFGAGPSLYEYGLALVNAYDGSLDLEEKLDGQSPLNLEAKTAFQNQRLKTLNASVNNYAQGFWKSLWTDANQITEGKKHISNQDLDHSRLMTVETFTNMMENGFLPNPFIPYAGLLSETFWYLDRNQLNFYFWPDRLASSYGLLPDSDQYGISNLGPLGMIWFEDEFNDIESFVNNWGSEKPRSFRIFESVVHDADTYQGIVYDTTEMNECIPLLPDAQEFVNKQVISRFRYSGLGGTPQQSLDTFMMSWSSSKTTKSFITPSADYDRNLALAFEAPSGNLSESPQRRFCVWSKNALDRQDPEFQESFVEFQISSPLVSPANGESTSYVRLEVEQLLAEGEAAYRPNFWNKTLKFISKKTAKKAWKRVETKNLIWDNYVDHILDISSIVITFDQQRFRTLPLWCIMIFKGLLGFLTKNIHTENPSTQRKGPLQSIEQYLIMLDLSLVRIEGIPDNEVIHYLTKYLDFGLAAPMINTNDQEKGVFARQNFALRSYSRYTTTMQDNVLNTKAFTTETGKTVSSAILFRPFPTRKELFKLFRFFINDALGGFGTRTYNITNLFDYLLKDTSIKTSVLDSVKSSKPLSIVDELVPRFEPEILSTLLSNEAKTAFAEKYPLYSKPTEEGQNLGQAVALKQPKTKKIRSKKIIQSGISWLSWKSLFRSSNARKDYLKNHKRDQFKMDYFGFSFGTKLHLITKLFPWIESRLTLEQDEWNIQENDTKEQAFKASVSEQLVLVDMDNTINDQSDQISIFLLANFAKVDPSALLTETIQQAKDKGYNQTEGVWTVHPLHAVWYYRIQPRRRRPNNTQLIAKEEELELFQRNAFIRNRIQVLYDDYLTMASANRIENEIFQPNQTRWVIGVDTTAQNHNCLRLGIPEAFPSVERSIKKVWDEIEQEIIQLIATCYQAGDFWAPEEPLSPALKLSDNEYRDPFRGFFVTDPPFIK
jgi:hypothetical protein